MTVTTADDARISQVGSEDAALDLVEELLVRARAIMLREPARL